MREEQAACLPDRKAWERRARKQESGSAKPSNEALDRAAARIADIRRLGSIESARRVGGIIVEEVYRGDLEMLRSRTDNEDSLRKLAAHARSNLSAATLSRAFNMFVTCGWIPGLRKPKQLEVGHLYAVLGLEGPQREKLLRPAELRRWPRAKLEAGAVALRPHRSRRSPTPPILRHVLSLRRIVARPLPLQAKTPAVVEKALAQLERRSEETSILACRCATQVSRWFTLKQRAIDVTHDRTHASRTLDEARGHSTPGTCGDQPIARTRKRAPWAPGRRESSHTEIKGHPWSPRHIEAREGNTICRNPTSGTRGTTCGPRPRLRHHPLCHVQTLTTL